MYPNSVTPRHDQAAVITGALTLVRRSVKTIHPKGSGVLGRQLLELQVQTLFSKSVIVIQPVGHDRQHVIDDKGDQCGNGTYERGRKDEAEVELCLCPCSENCEITHHDHRR